MTRNRAVVLGAFVAVLLLSVAGEALPGARRPALAQSTGWAVFAPLHGGSSASRLFSFSGFQAGEVLDLSFQAPDGTMASVGDAGVFNASAQDDGTGQFNFTPSDWLRPIETGQWTVSVSGESSGVSLAVTLYIDEGSER